MSGPKVFISYSWSTSAHRDLIRSYAERLVHDGVDVVFDQWSLSEGQDKYAFMEKTVNDPSVSHVLIFSDQQYAQKADERKAGVGTESQLISKEIYDKIDQKKFIPIACERRGDGEPCMPAFLKSRISIDFSTPEAANSNWEQLLRALYNKPLYQKPELGSPPAFIEDSARPSLPTIGKYGLLRETILNARPGAALARRDFLDAAIGYADSFRVRKAPAAQHIDEQILADLHNLLAIRDQLVDWIMLESAAPSPQFDDVLTDFLEKILALKYRPPEISQWSDGWFDALGIFAYEMFLYAVAALLSAGRDQTLKLVFSTQYLLPEEERHREGGLASFDEFFTYASSLAARKSRLKLNRISLIADIIKERATRKDIPFRDIMQAELVVLLVTLLSENTRWYPHTLVYAGHGGMKFPFFVRAAQHRYFERIKLITGIETGDELRQKFMEGCSRHEVGRWEGLRFWANVSFPDAMSLEALDTVK